MIGNRKTAIEGKLTRIEQIEKMKPCQKGFYPGTIIEFDGDPRDIQYIRENPLYHVRSEEFNEVSEMWK